MIPHLMIPFSVADLDLTNVEVVTLLLRSIASSSAITTSEVISLVKVLGLVSSAAKLGTGFFLTSVFAVKDFVTSFNVGFDFVPLTTSATECLVVVRDVLTF